MNSQLADSVVQKKLLERSDMRLGEKSNKSGNNESNWNNLQTTPLSFAQRVVPVSKFGNVLPPSIISILPEQ